VSEAYDVVVVSNELCAVIWEPWSSAHTRERTVAAGGKNLSTQEEGGRGSEEEETVTD